jgi:hypothetical protein
MPSRCCVPGCNSNYDSALKTTQNNRGMSIFKFPKNEERKQAWLKAIPRDDFTPSSSSVVCQLHFHSTDIVRYDKHLQPDGSTKELLLNRPRLKDNAIPSIFPNLPSYLTKSKPKERNDPQSRRNAVCQRQIDNVTNFLNSDIIIDFNDLKNKISTEVNMSGWEFKISDNGIYFFTLNFSNNNLTIDTSIYVSQIFILPVMYIFLF